MVVKHLCLKGGLGTKGPAQFADLLILREHPYEDIVVLQDPLNIPAVIKGGEIYLNLLKPCSYRIDPEGIEQRLSRSVKR